MRILWQMKGPFSNARRAVFLAIGCVVCLLASPTAIMTPAVAGEVRPPELGDWLLTGNDGQDWQATLVFVKRQALDYQGYMNWRSLNGEQGSGVESFQGQFDPRNGKLLLHGKEISHAQGNIATGATFEARVADGGQSLVEGIWYGPDIEPGTWSAIWLYSHSSEANTNHNSAGP